MLVERVRGTIEQHRLLAPDESILVGVSGGIDSVVLLHVLRRLAPIYRWSLTIAHLDHGLRDASPDDARFVEQLAEQAQIPIISKRIEVSASASLHALGVEGAAREIRQRFFADVADSIGATRIALGHTATDRAETVLYNLARGAGVPGLAGIAPETGRTVRPLIALSREEILAYARQESLAWHEDASNADVSFARNRIRHRVLPQLARINPRVVEAICRAGELASNAASVGSYLVASLWDDVVACEGAAQIFLRRTVLAGLPVEVRALVLREALFRVRGNLNGIDRTHVDRTCELICAPLSHGEAHLPGAWVRLQFDELILASQPFGDDAPWSSPVELGRTAFPEHSFALDLRILPRAESAPIETAADRATEQLDADRVLLPLHVRNRRNGDRFVPLGMERSVKLKDFLSNEKVPYFDRDRTPLVCDRERILWVAGVRLANEARVTDETRRVLVMRLEALPW